MNQIYDDLASLAALWEESAPADMRGDDLLAAIIEDDEDYVDEYFDPDEFE